MESRDEKSSGGIESLFVTVIIVDEVNPIVLLSILFTHVSAG